VISADIYGVPSDYDSIRALCKEHEIPLIEDAAEGLGGFYGTAPMGTLGDFGIFSFNANKILTGGSGGMVLTQSTERSQSIRGRIHQDAIEDGSGRHRRIGFNCGMSAMAAALLLEQWPALSERVERRRKIGGEYQQLFSRVHGLQILLEPDRSRSSRWLNTIFLSSEQFPDAPNQILKELQCHRIESRRVWFPIHEQPPYAGSSFFAHCSEGPSISHRLHESGICLPSGTGLTLAEQEEVASLVCNLLSRIQD
jgi:pyridoxal phosphate-dependent aminotransferase EpsN